MNRKILPVSARRLLLIIALPFLSFGCEKLSNKKDDLALTCGSDFKLSESGKYIQFRNEDLGLLDSNSVASIQSLAVTDDKSVELRVSSRGCVAYEGEEVLARASINGRMLSAVVVKNEENLEKIFARLTEVKSPEFTFSCPAQGLVAGNSVTLPLTVESNHLQNISYELYARSLKTKDLKKILTKPFGSLSPTFANIDISDLPEAEYAIEVYQSSMQGDSLNNFEFVHFDQPCNLHKIANITDIESDFATQIVKKGEPIQIPSINEVEYESCVERIEEHSLVNSCQPHLNCKDTGSFNRVKNLVAESPGLFKYFYKAVDRVGRLSNLACATVLVSDTAPKIELRWSDLKLAKPNSLLSDFNPIIHATVNAAHSLVKEKDLNLQCRGVFKLATGENISASSVKCTSGECKGSPM